MLVVGPVVVLQQTPLSVTGVPPSLVTSPPLTALFFVIPVIAVVVISASAADAVVKVISLPYAASPPRLQYALA